MPGAKATPLTTVTSMSQAAYLMINGLKLVSGRKDGLRKKEFVFLFEDPDDRVETLAMDFLTSESRQFDHAVRDLRALVNASQRQ